MTDEIIFSMMIEPELRDQFLAEVEAADRPAAQVLREFMQDFIRRQREIREHDAWFRSEVEQALRELDDPDVELIDNEEIAASWQQQRAALIRRAGKRPE
jgi:hypothetical protein